MMRAREQIRGGDRRGGRHRARSGPPLPRGGMRVLITTGAPADLIPQALQGVKERRLCKGCERPFVPARVRQQHGTPSCRVLAHRRRKAEQASDLLARGLS
jgi:hypothetical protein